MEVKNLGRNKYPEVTVERILNVATKLFLEKGYENATIQDITNTLADLSKGAIYHHFKSKEEIINAVIDRINRDVHAKYYNIKVSKDLSGLEKLKKLFYISLGNSNQEIVIKVLPNLLKNPKILALQLDSTINELASHLIEPIIIEGIEDGTIKTEYPKELAEVISLLANIYINPLIFNCTAEELYRKCLFFKHILSCLNIDIFDDTLISMVEQLGNIHKQSN